MFRHLLAIFSSLWSSGQSAWLQNGDVLCFLWGTNWIYICHVEENRPPLWSSGQSSWLQNGDVLCFLWGTNWTYVYYVEESRPPLWYSGQSSWLHNGDVLCFLWGTNWICMCYVEESRPLGFGVGVLLAADSQSTNKSGYRASLWDPWPDFILLFFRLTITLFCFQCILSDEKSGL
jgi:hypothetical protein